MRSISPAAQDLSRALSDYIRQKIAQEGPLSFSAYMQLALYHPQWGYYNNGSQKFGAGGDFITAPEISPLFGACIAAQIRPVLAALEPADILEFGAGSGQLAVDILSALRRAGQPFHRYYILEVSAALQARQREKILQHLPELQDRVIWLECLPEHFQGVMIANEVLDAMPVARFCFQENAFLECVVTEENSAWVEKWRPVPPESMLARQLAHAALDLAEGYSSEINLLLPGWLAGVAAAMTRGLLLLVDYGFSRQEYYHPDRRMGTLMCHYQHRAHTDPYFLPGLQDMTAHVDFTAVAESAIAAGFALAGYTTQAHFLLDAGLMHFGEQLSATAAEAWATSQAIKKLVLPSEMGELFKVMALTKALSIPLLGFGLKNMRGKL
jgi:SAM-dependent MidA family methyltransferase